MTDPFGLVGQVLDGQFRIDEYVGEGGFGVVYRGLNLGLDEPIAIKCLKLGGALYGQLAENFVQRFRDESKLLYKLSQGNLHIVRSIAAGSVVAPISGALIPYMVLEWLEGRSLQQDFEARRKQKLEGRPLEEIIELFAGAADGLSYAHKQGVVHRDLNPGNVFLVEAFGTTTSKVLDFGVAKLARDHSMSVDLRAQTLGNIRIFAPAYGSPEQFDDKVGEVGTWSDVYSFSLVVLEAMRDRTVVEGEHLGEYARLVLGEARPTPRSLGIQCGDEIENCFARSLSLSPKDRWQTMGDFWVVLKNAAKIESARRQGLPIGPKETAPVMSSGTKTRSQFAETARAEVPESVLQHGQVPQKGGTLAIPVMSPFAAQAKNRNTPPPAAPHAPPTGAVPAQHAQQPRPDHTRTVSMGPGAAGQAHPQPSHGASPSGGPPPHGAPAHGPAPGYGGQRHPTPYAGQPARGPSLPPGQMPNASRPSGAAPQYVADPNERISVASVPGASSTRVPLILGVALVVFAIIGAAGFGLSRLVGHGSAPSVSASAAASSAASPASASAAMPSALAASAEPPASAPEPPSSAPEVASSAVAPEASASASTVLPTQAPAASTKPAASVAPKPSASVDPRAYSEDNAKKALNRQSGAFIACKDKENPIDKGTAMVTFTPDGTVSNVDLAPPMKGTKTGNCVVSQLKRAQMAAFDGGPQNVAFVVTIP